MTWGSHCSMCGLEDCDWVNSPACDGRYRTLEAEVKKHRAELATLRETLAWYGDEGNYRQFAPNDGKTFGLSSSTCFVFRDKGQRARKEMKRT